ncbi:hypothetical protein Dsin_009188 [Dipteronia sinensis]|uniref:RNase H type-1 domain-containing protein n=1 Tax=Dipteronia sinensis TaxID=43782 RepID=A0AAE0A4A7_9ROSI|nr:hypothetical protein Dsin_023186 [Dipteronia sinensis]KAK3222163.1 hypothetical protein Dsin_009188 [Dipteronia sinensis]
MAQVWNLLPMPFFGVVPPGRFGDALASTAFLTALEASLCWMFCRDYLGSLAETSWPLHALFFRQFGKIGMPSSLVIRPEILTLWPPRRERFSLNFRVPIGLGAILRDYKGKVIMAVSKPLPRRFSTEMGDFLALREGLRLAKLHNLPIQIAEVDASNLVSILNSNVSFLGDACFIVNDITALFLEVGICKCQAIPRLGNSSAHNLARLASSSNRECFWLDPSPSCFLSLV